MAIPFSYNLRSAFRRKSATALTLSAIAFSVAVLVLVLALARGFETALSGTGSDRNVIVMRAGATSEGVSGVSRSTARVVGANSYVARDSEGNSLAQPEIYAAFSLNRADGGRTNIPVRGTGPVGYACRDGLKLEGRMFAPGRYELVVGKALVGRVQGCALQGVIDLAGYAWRIVGVLDSNGAAYDSELWCDAEIFLRVMDRPGFSTLFCKLADGHDAKSVSEKLAADPRLNSMCKGERTYFAEQSGALAITLKILAWFLAAIMGTGAVFGATNTMLASVQMRTREIGTLLALGFRPRAIFLGFLMESAIIGILGGAIGVALGYQCNGIATGTTNWATFTEQSFAFRVTGDVVVSAMVLATLIGVVGGALPARRASKLSPRAALRAL